MRLLVIVPDRLSSVLDKGEFQFSYYNPGNLADEVHILMTNDDKPDPTPLQDTVGAAKLFLHNFSDDLTLAQKPFPFLDRWRLKRWAHSGVKLIASIAPDMIRCHGVDWNAYLASQAKAKLGIPYCISLHINPDVNSVRRYLEPSCPEEVRHNRFYEILESDALQGANMVLPVYKPILPYLERKRVKPNNIRVCYNVLNKLSLEQKTQYTAHKPFRFVGVGRLIKEKNPEHILEALVNLPNAQYTIIGDGPLLPALAAKAEALGIAARVHFFPAMQNHELCALLPTQDAFVVHTDYFELNKSVLEALLTGLPVIINRRIGIQVPEFGEGNFVRLVDNNTFAYHKAMQEIMLNNEARAQLGQAALAHSQARWAPATTEAVYTNIYNELLGKRRGIKIS